VKSLSPGHDLTPPVDSRGSVVVFPSLQKKGIVGRMFSARASRLGILLS